MCVRAASGKDDLQRITYDLEATHRYNSHFRTHPCPPSLDLQLAPQLLHIGFKISRGIVTAVRTIGRHAAQSRPYLRLLG
jgi:hypothetical protein